jgi:hypothetical protein
MQRDYPDPVESHILGFDVLIDHNLGHLAVAHSGSITWDQLQGIKNSVWGAEARAIEVYPSNDSVVNNAQMRHLWLLGADDFCPDLLGHVEPKQTLERRFNKAWDAAKHQ